MAAPTVKPFNTLNTEGIDFTQTYTPYVQSSAVSSTNSPDNLGPMFTVGTHVLGSNGTEYVFCQASAAITQYQAVSISTTFQATGLTLATLRQLTDYGFAQVAVAANAYFWCAIRGQGLGVLARQGSLANVPVYISNVSAGVVTTTSVRNTSGGTLLNVVLTTSSTSSPSGVVVVNATWPGTSRTNG